MVMAGAGGVNHEELCNLATQHFGKIGHTYDAEIPLELNCRYTGKVSVLIKIRGSHEKVWGVDLYARIYGNTITFFN